MARKGMLRAVLEKEVKYGQESFKLRFDACIVFVLCICILFLLHPIIHYLYNNTVVVQYQ